MHPLYGDEITPPARLTVGGNLVDSEQFTEGVPEYRSKFLTSVTVNSQGQTKMLYPASEEGNRAIGGKGQHKWNCFGPPGSPDHDGKKVWVVGRLRKWTHQVNIRVRKMKVRDGDVLKL
jgi:hypothetical protein